VLLHRIRYGVRDDQIAEPGAAVSRVTRYSGAGFAASARFQWRSVIWVVRERTLMAWPSAGKVRRGLRVGLLLGMVSAGCVGCQTFSLSEADFQRQQRGEMVDPDTIAVVGAAGSIGYIGVGIGEVVAHAVGR
jgi:hypothetical protein